MLGSSVLDVLLGVVFTFLGVSLAASAITEAIASALKLRQNTLVDGVKDLLNDPEFNGLALALYNHALVNPLGQGTAGTVAELQTKPAYIDARHFATALIDVLQARAPGETLAGTVAEIRDPQLRQAFSALLARAGGELSAFQAALGAWFDSAMDRLSGAYKRRAQMISFVAALAVAALLNADALHVTSELWSHPVLAQALEAEVKGDVNRLPDVLDKLEAHGLIGWTGRTVDLGGHPGSALAMIAGWIVAAAASLFGAPFWFDTLQRIVRVRGTGVPAGDSSGRKPDM